MRGAAALLALALLSGGCALWRSEPTPARAAGGVLVDSDRRMTLYTFDRDVADSGKSACVAECAALWPPLIAAPDARPVREYEPIGRPDGSRQWSYNGKPLYHWSKDAKPGDRGGDGVGNLWRVAKP